MFTGIIESKLKDVVLPEVLESVKKGWTPALEAEMKMVLVKFVKNVADATPNGYDDTVVWLIAKFLGVNSSDMP